jgi:hypothetical protein
LNSQIPLFGNDNNFYLCKHMIVRIVSALYAFREKNTNDDFGRLWTTLDDFGTVYFQPKFENLVLNRFKRDFYR